MPGFQLAVAGLAVVSPGPKVGCSCAKRALAGGFNASCGVRRTVAAASAGAARVLAGTAHVLGRDLCDDDHTRRNEPQELFSARHHGCNSCQPSIVYAPWVDLVSDGLQGPGKQPSFDVASIARMGWKSARTRRRQRAESPQGAGLVRPRSAGVGSRTPPAMRHGAQLACVPATETPATMREHPWPCVRGGSCTGAAHGLTQLPGSYDAHRPGTLAEVLLTDLSCGVALCAFPQVCRVCEVLCAESLGNRRLARKKSHDVGPPQRRGKAWQSGCPG